MFGGDEGSHRVPSVGDHCRRPASPSSAAAAAEPGFEVVRFHRIACRGVAATRPVLSEGPNSQNYYHTHSRSAACAVSARSLVLLVGLNLENICIIQLL